MKSGRFITFEGCEGAGKSTQTSLLINKLAISGVEAVLTREPGGTPLGEEICRLLKWGKFGDINPLSELLLFNASRAELMATLIVPAIESGKTVICDRFTDSSLVYQGVARGLSADVVAKVNDIATGGITPDLTILLDIPVATGRHRKHTAVADRFEQENGDFHQAVRQAYLELAWQNPKRWKIIDGSQSTVEVAEAVWSQVKAMLEN